MWDRGYVRADPTLAAQERWSAHVTKMYAIMLMRKAKSWFTGYNSNIPGHEHGKVRYFVYNGGTPKYVAAINDVVAKDYEGIVFDSGARRRREARTQAERCGVNRTGNLRMACTKLFGAISMPPAYSISGSRVSSWR